jgi:hypothetical protein
MAMTEAGQLAQAESTAQYSYDVAAAEQDRNGMAWLASALGRIHTYTREARDRGPVRQ